MSVHLYVAKDLGNRWTDMILFQDEDFKGQGKPQLFQEN